MIRIIRGEGVYILQLFKLIRLSFSNVDTETGPLISFHFGIHNFCIVLTFEWRDNANSF